MKETFANRMAQAIRASGKTLQQVADLAGTSKGQVSQWQTVGKVQVENIKAHVLERICTTLNIRPRWLMYGELPMRPISNFNPEATRLWDSYQKATLATQQAVDLLLLPSNQRRSLETLAPRAYLGIELLETYAAANIDFDSYTRIERLPERAYA